MKILYISTISNTINSFLIPHIKMLINSGHEVEIAFKTDHEVDCQLIQMGCKIHEVNFNRNPIHIDNLKAYNNLKKIISEGDYDVVHTHTPVASAIARIVCKNMKTIKIIYTAHGFHFYKGAPIKNWLLYYPVERWLSKYTDILITINQEDYFIGEKKFTEINKVYKLPGTGINSSRFEIVDKTEKLSLRRKNNIPINSFVLIFPAELNNNKNQEFLLKTIIKLKDEISEIKLLLLGEGVNQKKYKQFIKKNNIEKFVYMMGFKENIEEFIKLSDVSISSSLREGLGLNLIEGMFCGNPVVAMDNRGHREIVINEVNGFLLPQDVDLWVKRIKEIYESDNLYMRMSTQSKELSKKFELKNVINKLEEIYRIL